MLKKIPYFPRMKRSNIPMLNKLVDAVNALRNISHDKTMRIENTERGVTFSSKAGVGGGGGSRKWAFCKVGAGTGLTIVAYLNTDLTGEEITVYCDIVPSTAAQNLNSSGPRLEVGTRIPVSFDNATSKWRYDGGPFIGGDTC